ncbi:transcriptional regulator, lysr family [Heliomicrobium modesticaldum Ice1]|uniref:Transcriptional regulator, lysr family n=1 Tax=Heliobacterium modesticaldum (strain ATCC 51547 / Ice1) TaxID=498761 RepID=B0TCS4_HELMI|nr:LysR family transcriptional regulator [Heliomicrobium modesticaldum]ABZ84100.1 transcriptional regulator, lysr family [Heliomicrobium modesticaldum Ice1]
MFVNTELYRAFYLVAREGSISKAAEQLYITQPAVSRSIQQLEEKLGCVLFFRTPKGVKLTKEGELLFPYIEQAFNFIAVGEKTLAQITALENGEITIAAGDTICKNYLPPHLKRFKEAYPGIRIHVTNENTPSTIRLLKKGKVDIGFVHAPVVNDPSATALLSIHEVLQIQDCFVVGEKYKELAARPRSLEELARYPLILLEKGSSSRIYIENFFAQHNIELKPEFELSDFELLIRFAQIDFGAACVIKNFVADELARGSLYEIQPLTPIPPRHVGVAHLQTIPLRTAAKAFLSFLLKDASNASISRHGT